MKKTSLAMLASLIFLGVAAPAFAEDAMLDYLPEEPDPLDAFSFTLDTRSRSRLIGGGADAWLRLGVEYALLEPESQGSGVRGELTGALGPSFDLSGFNADLGVGLGYEFNVFTHGAIALMYDGKIGLHVGEGSLTNAIAQHHTLGLEAGMQHGIRFRFNMGIVASLVPIPPRDSDLGAIITSIGLIWRM